MDFEIFGFIAFAVAFLWVACSMVNWCHRFLDSSGQLPPGPRRWPVVGNIFQLSWEPPHLSVTKLACQHGPIMTFWLGSMVYVVISSEEVAREMFKNHDAELAGRKIYESIKGSYGNEGSIITAQYGSKWRMFRRLCTTEFFVSNRLDAMKDVRRKCVDQMLEFIEGARNGGTNAIDIGRFFFLLTFNLMGNLMFSKDLLDPKSESGANFLPCTKSHGTRRFDPQGIKRRTHFHIENAFQIEGEFIKERMEGMENGCNNERKKRNDYLDVLLEFRGDGIREPSRFSSKTINIIVLEMFTAGTDTTTGTLEWAMTELLRNPTELKKLQAELRSTIGPGKKLDEKDIENLPYLTAVIKETLRLHPPLPFLFPHMAITSCKMLGYTIPKDTQVLVNVWAIGRDPNSWDDPLVFKPERFLEQNNHKMDYKGKHFEFIPFGSGRRMCPALPLASRMLPLALGSLLHSFDWTLPDGLKAEDLDMTAGMGMTLRKSVPLKVIPLRYNYYMHGQSL
ncbi:hypothetical protein DITRI_Ditri06bG0050300 [Diplodiscus trichospermus]